jgi:formylglycine-generating enzyme required for sulfatase activity
MSRSAIMAGGLNSVATDASKIYALPTEDEWYKAAYYSVSGNSYSLYADGTSDKPPTGGGETGWNYNNVNSAENYTRDVAYGSSEQNSTVNMNGNVSEWMEDSTGFIRGGRHDGIEYTLRSSISYSKTPSNEYSYVGLRPVEVVPEPATVSMMALVAGLGFLIRRHFVG